MQNRSGIVGNNNNVSRVVIFLIFKNHSRATLPRFLPTARWLKNDLGYLDGQHRVI